MTDSFRPLGIIAQPIIDRHLKVLGRVEGEVRKAVSDARRTTEKIEQRIDVLKREEP